MNGEHGLHKRVHPYASSEAGESLFSLSSVTRRRSLTYIHNMCLCE